MRSILLLLCLGFLITGCIRLTGSAGYWHKGSEDPAPKGKTVGFDTADVIPGSPAPGSIVMPEEQ